MTTTTDTQRTISTKLPDALWLRFSAVLAGRGETKGDWLLRKIQEETEAK